MTEFVVVMLLVVGVIMWVSRRSQTGTQSTGAGVSASLSARPPRTAPFAPRTAVVAPLSPRPDARGMGAAVPVTLIEVPISPWTPTAARPEPVASVLSTYRDRSYQIDRVAETCTCVDWRTRRFVAPERTLARYCKHLRQDAITDDAIHISLPEFEGPIRGQIFFERMHDLVAVGSVPKVGPVYACFSLHTGWMDVCFRSPNRQGVPRETGAPVIAGFTFDEDRWAYGRGPNGSTAVRPFLLGMWELRERLWREFGDAAKAELITAVARVEREESERVASEERAAAEAAAEEARHPARCDVCFEITGARLPLEAGAWPGTHATCTECGMTQVITPSGVAMRPEMLAVYHRFLGDPLPPNPPAPKLATPPRRPGWGEDDDDGSARTAPTYAAGLIPQRRIQREADLARVRARLNAGTITLDECQSQAEAIYTASNNDISVFHAQKRAAIAEQRAIEEQARRAVKKARKPPRAKKAKAPPAAES